MTVYLVAFSDELILHRWILHGKDDGCVPVQCSLDFAAVVDKASSSSDFILDVIDDEPSYHGFDAT